MRAALTNEQKEEVSLLRKPAQKAQRQRQKKRKAADALKGLKALGFTKRPRFYCSATVGAADTAIQ